MVLINKIHIPFKQTDNKKLAMLMNDMIQFDKSNRMQSNFWIVLINNIHIHFIQTNDEKLQMFYICTYEVWQEL